MIQLGILSGVPWVCSTIPRPKLVLLWKLFWSFVQGWVQNVFFSWPLIGQPITINLKLFQSGFQAVLSEATFRLTDYGYDTGIKVITSHEHLGKFSKPSDSSKFLGFFFKFFEKFHFWFFWIFLWKRKKGEWVNQNDLPSQLGGSIDFKYERNLKMAISIDRFTKKTHHVVKKVTKVWFLIDSVRVTTEWYPRAFWSPTEILIRLYLLSVFIFFF